MTHIGPNPAAVPSRAILATILLVLACGTAAGTPLAGQESTAADSSPAPAPAVVTLKAPYPEASENLALMDHWQSRVEVALGYRLARDAASPPAGDPDGFVRRLERVSAEATSLRLGIALAPFPEGGFDFVLFGTQSTTDAPADRNPDLPTAHALLAEMVSAVSSRLAERNSPKAEDLTQEIYPLSYIHADRAIALLKVLGYTTVEYSATEAESLTEKLYSPVQQGAGTLPIVVKLVDSEKTSLLDPAPVRKELATATLEQQRAIRQLTAPADSAVPDIGGTYLHTSTSGEPQQRLMIVYDRHDPEALERLLNLLRDKVDVAARQIVIEALVIELNSDRLRDLGVSFSGVSGDLGAAFGGTDPETGLTNPFAFTFDSDRNAADLFNVRVQALVDRGQAEILSKPSVLVLDGRQARIQIGQQVPVVKSTSTQAGIISSVDYFPVGIVLNLRPRISEDGSEITMQAETIVSAVNQLASAEASGSAGVLLAPVVDNRQVQTFVRVSDNSPFIIGGLISTELRRQVSGIPWLSDLPGLGALFRRTTNRQFKREVIVVLTPHVVPLRERTFSYLIPKDSDRFDSFGHQLFRNAYRLRGADIFDLRFVQESKVLRDLAEQVRRVVETRPSLARDPEFALLLRGEIPGEEILVRRMLWEIVDRTGYAGHIDPARIIFFEGDSGASSGRFQLRYLQDLLRDLGPEQGLLMTFDARAEGTPERPFVQPAARIARINVNARDYVQRLTEANRVDGSGALLERSILLASSHEGIRVTPVELLSGVLALKRILELNRSLPLTLKDFQIGRQVVFPAEEELQQRYHVVDQEAARLFYEVFNYYPAFEREFNRRARDLRNRLDD